MKLPDSSQVFVLGATHHRVPIEVRERLALSAESAEAIRSQFASLAGLEELVILNTCNRVEFYGVASGETAISAVRDGFCAKQQFDREDFARFCVDLRDQKAVQHLYEVASGLDSQMLGETEIFGQVKDAYARAQTQGSTGAVLNRVFQKAFHAAKQVRTETAITLGQVSVANVAVELAGSIFGSLKETRTLLVGAGEIGEKTARAFLSRGAQSLTVSSRTLANAIRLAEDLGASAIPFEQREQHLHEFDNVVCATSAPSTVITSEAVAVAMARRRARPLLFVDLALPRDVDPGVAELENVYLYNLDDLAKVADENRRLREAQVLKARTIIEAKARQLWENLNGDGSR